MHYHPIFTTNKIWHVLKFSFKKALQLLSCSRPTTPAVMGADMAATFLKFKINIHIQLKYDGFISTGQKTFALQPFSCILWRGDQSCDKQISAPVCRQSYHWSKLWYLWVSFIVFKTAKIQFQLLPASQECCFALPDTLTVGHFWPIAWLT